MDRPCFPLARPLPALLMLLVLVNAAGTAAALHTPLLTVELAGLRVEAPALAPSAGHASQGLVAPAPAPAEPAPTAQAPAPQPAVASTWIDFAPWILAGLLLAALVAILLVLALRRPRDRAAPPARPEDVRRELELARLCTEAAVQRSARLAARNAELRHQLSSTQDVARPAA